MCFSLLITRIREIRSRHCVDVAEVGVGWQGGGGECVEVLTGGTASTWRGGLPTQSVCARREDRVAHLST